MKPLTLMDGDVAAPTVWFTGTFATIGLSYLGYTQGAMSDPPPELAAGRDRACTTCTTDLGTAFALGDFLGWADMMAHQEQGALGPAVVSAQRDQGCTGPPSACRWARPDGNWLADGPAGTRTALHPDRDDLFWIRMR